MNVALRTERASNSSVQLAAPSVELAGSWPALWYGQLSLVIWTFYMLARRMSDLLDGYHEINPITLLPLLAMVPFALAVVHARFSGIPRGFKTLAWVWAGSFAMSFAVSIVTRNIAGAAFDILDFGLPLFFGLWLTRKRLDADAILARFGGTIIWCAALTSIYGIAQFVSPPPWDALWMSVSGANGIGIPVAYQVRVFSTLTAPSTYAAFLACSLVITVGRWHVRPLLNTIPLVVGGIALALTLERSDWLALAVGLAFYLVFSPRRARSAVGLGIVGLILAGVVSYAAVSSVNVQQSLAHLQDRLFTLENTDQDLSTQDRRSQSDAALSSARNQPFGFGLGVFGVASKLHQDDPDLPGWIDNGYLARLLEMGYLGLAGYLFTTVGTLVYSVRQWLQSRGDPRIQAAVAVAIAVQVVLVVLDASHDHHSAYLGVMFWMCVAVAAAATNAE